MAQADVEAIVPAPVEPDLVLARRHALEHCVRSDLVVCARTLPGRRRPSVDSPDIVVGPRRRRGGVGRAGRPVLVGEPGRARGVDLLAVPALGLEDRPVSLGAVRHDRDEVALVVLLKVHPLERRDKDVDPNPSCVRTRAPPPGLGVHRDREIEDRRGRGRRAARAGPGVGPGLWAVRSTLVPTDAISPTGTEALRILRVMVRVRIVRGARVVGSAVIAKGLARVASIIVPNGDPVRVVLSVPAAM